MKSLNNFWLRWKWHIIGGVSAGLLALLYLLNLLSRNRSEISYKERLNDLLIEQEEKIIKDIGNKYKQSNAKDDKAIEAIDKKIKELENERINSDKPKTIKELSDAFANLGY